MIITKQKPFADLIDRLGKCAKVFLVGCGECATTCKTGGKEELSSLADALQKAGKQVVGSCIPSAPCVSAQIKTEFAKNMKNLREAEAIIVLACGLGVQSAKANDRLGLVVLPGCDTLCGALLDASGNFYEACSMCGSCVLDITDGICPVTTCSKGLMNGPCGGMNKGKCEVDPQKDCAWVLIFKETARHNRQEVIRGIIPARDHQKSLKPHRILMEKT